MCASSCGKVRRTRSGLPDRDTGCSWLTVDYLTLRLSLRLRNTCHIFTRHSLVLFDKYWCVQQDSFPFSFSKFSKPPDCVSLELVHLFKARDVNFLRFLWDVWVSYVIKNDDSTILIAVLSFCSSLFAFPYIPQYLNALRSMCFNQKQNEVVLVPVNCINGVADIVKLNLGVKNQTS